ncbi:hypothetical protein JTE90_016377 [Oedothorax gibbosus]|uniref:Uncharacterized protein n=1 Tax=Oedothorax gibbosus TaxID=931172 RepID=A0AAV6UAP9_9ARAC|nr:hypothetical protein JTE90_016377 [Oedothorax gibbosus]
MQRLREDFTLLLSDQSPPSHQGCKNLEKFLLSDILIATPPWKSQRDAAHSQCFNIESDTHESSNHRCDTLNMVDANDKKRMVNQGATNHIKKILNMQLNDKLPSIQNEDSTNHLKSLLNLDVTNYSSSIQDGTNRQKSFNLNQYATNHLKSLLNLDVTNYSNGIQGGTNRQKSFKVNQYATNHLKSILHLNKTDRLNGTLIRDDMNLPKNVQIKDGTIHQNKALTQNSANQWDQTTNLTVSNHGYCTINNDTIGQRDNFDSHNIKKSQNIVVGQNAKNFRKRVQKQGAGNSKISSYTKNYSYLPPNQDASNNWNHIQNQYGSYPQNIMLNQDNTSRQNCTLKQQDLNPQSWKPNFQGSTNPQKIPRDRNLSYLWKDVVNESDAYCQIINRKAINFEISIQNKDGSNSKNIYSHNQDIKFQPN